MPRSSDFAGDQSMSKNFAAGEARPVLEHVAPPEVRSRGVAHVIRHEIHDVAEGQLRETRDERRVLLRAAKLGADLVVVHDVVAVRASGGRREVGRGVAGADAQPREVRRHLARRGEREVLVHLQPVCADGNVDGMLFHHAAADCETLKITPPGRWN